MSRRRSLWPTALSTGCLLPSGPLTSPGHRLATEVHAGQVYVNTYGAGGGVELPFGGFKKSGYGREKGYEALDTFTATKTVVMHL